MRHTSHTCIACAAATKDVTFVAAISTGRSQRVQRKEPRSRMQKSEEERAWGVGGKLWGYMRMR
jgi:hypothetical protein